MKRKYFMGLPDRRDYGNRKQRKLRYIRAKNKTRIATGNCSKTDIITSEYGSSSLHEFWKQGLVIEGLC